MNLVPIRLFLEIKGTTPIKKSANDGPGTSTRANLLDWRIHCRYRQDILERILTQENIDLAISLGINNAVIKKRGLVFLLDHYEKVHI